MTQKTPKNKKYQKHEKNPKYHKTPYKRKKPSKRDVDFAINLILSKTPEWLEQEINNRTK